MGFKSRRKEIKEAKHQNKLQRIENKDSKKELRMKRKVWRQSEREQGRRPFFDAIGGMVSKIKGGGIRESSDSFEDYENDRGSRMIEPMTKSFDMAKMSPIIIILIVLVGLGSIFKNSNKKRW